MLYYCFRHINLGRMERQKRENEANITLLNNKLINLEGRMYSGEYLWRIPGYARYWENARGNVARGLYSRPIYTSFYGYKLCLRYGKMYPIYIPRDSIGGR